MAATVLSNLGLTYNWDLGTFYKTDMDNNLLKLDTAVQLAVIDRDLTAPPGSPSQGDTYIPAATATGAWAGQENNIAVFIGASWVFYTPSEGWTAWINDEDEYLGWSGTIWVPATGGGGGGDVFGPGSSTADGLVRFNGTTGKVIQDTTAVVMDNDGRISGHKIAKFVVNGTSRTFVGTDSGKYITTTNASPVTLTLPQTSTESITTGWQVTVMQRGTGQVTIATEGSDTLESKNSATKTSGQFSVLTIIKETDGTPNNWIMFGDIVT